MNFSLGPLSLVTFVTLSQGKKKTYLMCPRWSRGEIGPNCPNSSLAFSLSLFIFGSASIFFVSLWSLADQGTNRSQLKAHNISPFTLLGFTCCSCFSPGRLVSSHGKQDTHSGSWLRQPHQQSINCISASERLHYTCLFFLLCSRLSSFIFFFLWLAKRLFLFFLSLSLWEATLVDTGF